MFYFMLIFILIISNIEILNKDEIKIGSVPHNIKHKNIMQHYKLIHYCTLHITIINIGKLWSTIYYIAHTKILNNNKFSYTKSFTFH